MPIRYIKHKRKKYTVDEVLKEGKLERFFPLSYIVQAIDERNWEGTPSVTQCLNGTREEFLKLTTDYDVKLEDRVWAIFGTAGHAILEQGAEKLNLSSEVRLHGRGVSGQRDLVEPYDGYHRIVDYKFIASYKAKTLDDPVTSESAWFDYTMQLNMYRILAQETPDHPELHPDEPCWLYGIIRDGGTLGARLNQINYKTFFKPVANFPNKDVIDYFEAKRDALTKAMETNIIPSKCTAHETWDGKKCSKYCSVKKECFKHE